MLLWQDIKIAVMKSWQWLFKRPNGYQNCMLKKPSISHKANMSSINQHLEKIVLEYLVCMGVKASGLYVSTKGT